LFKAQTLLTEDTYQRGKTDEMVIFLALDTLKFRGHIQKFRRNMLAPCCGLKYVNSGIRFVILESCKKSGPKDFHSEAGCG
jgi:hypothetical protein